jgi:hypothetical protein
MEKCKPLQAGSARVDHSAKSLYTLRHDTSGRAGTGPLAIPEPSGSIIPRTVPRVAQCSMLTLVSWIMSDTPHVEDHFAGQAQLPP